MITSKDNPKVKLARQLGRYKKTRYDEQLFILENKHFIEEWIQKRPNNISYILYSGATNPLETLINNSITCLAVEERIFNQIPTVKNCSGIIAVVKMPPQDNTFDSTFKTVVLLHDINKPSNVGAIIRNAVAFHVDAIITTKNCADIYNPESIRAAAGSTTELPIFTLEETISIDQLSNFKSYYLDPKAKKSIHEKDNYEQELYIFGSEMGFDSTLAPLLHKATGLRIKQSKLVDSLNVAVSSGIILAQQYNQ